MMVRTRRHSPKGKPVVHRQPVQVSYKFELSDSPAEEKKTLVVGSTIVRNIRDMYYIMIDFLSAI